MGLSGLVFCCRNIAWLLFGWGCGCVGVGFRGVFFVVCVVGVLSCFFVFGFLVFTGLFGLGDFGRIGDSVFVLENT